MKQTRITMGMPITIEIVGEQQKAYINQIFSYFRSIDKRFSTYITSSEISQINRGLDKSHWSKEMKRVMKLSEDTKKQTNGYFNIELNGKIDPSGLVKGLAVHDASKQLLDLGLKNFYIEAGGDIEMHGTDNQKQLWSVGIRNPFNTKQIIKVLRLTNRGVATSGSYIRGDHIYNPHNPKKKLAGVASLTVIGPNIYEADRMATAAYAMGEDGLSFIEKLKGFEGYMVLPNKNALYTTGLMRYAT